MAITLTPTTIPDVLVIEPDIFRDERGYFYESFNEKDFSLVVGHSVTFVQDNHSFSYKGVLRGLHYQIELPQGKLVRVCSGAVFDVAVDLRQSSVTYGKSVGIELSAENKKQLWIPPGFAHGFLVLSETAEFLYKTTDYWHAKSEHCINWNDPHLSIHWPLAGGCNAPILSSNDAAGLSWSMAPKF